MAKLTQLYFLACKADPTHTHIQQAFLPHSYIYSVCSYCKETTGAGLADINDHYQLYQTVGKKRPGETYEQFWDRLQAEVESNRTRYEVSEFSQIVPMAKPSKLKGD